MNTLRVAFLFLKLAVLNELQYRVNFFLQVLRSLIQLGTGLVVLALVYSRTPELNGWTQPELLALLGIQILLGGVIRAFIQPNMNKLMEDVQEGTLDHVLTKPEDSQVLISVRETQAWQTVDVVSGVVLVTIGLTGVERSVGVLDALAFAVALTVGAAMIYCFWLIVTTGAFWVVRMDHVWEMFEGLYQTGRWPVGIYPGWLRYSVTFLVPIAFAVTVPAEAVTSRLEWETLLLSLGFGAALFVFTRWFWRFGLRHYSGASA